MLTVREHMMLRFEAERYKYIGAKDQAIRDLFGVIPTHYYQELNQLVDRADAYAAYPMVVKAIRRRRRHRNRAHIARTLGVYGVLWESQVLRRPA